MKRLLTALIVSLLAVPASAADWTAKAKIVSGNCGSNAVASLSEQPGILKVSISLNGKVSGEADVKLAADGSGTIVMQGAGGRIHLNVPAGNGKRTFKTILVDGTCEWVWN